MTTQNMPRVLVIDDEMSIHKSFELTFTQKNIKAEYAFNGKNALELIKKDKHSFAIVFLDHNFLDVEGNTIETGSDIAKKIKAINEEITIVIVSGDDSSEAYNSWIKSGIDKVLYKPFKGENVIALAEMAFEKHKEENFSDDTNLLNGKCTAELGIIGKSDELEKAAQKALKYAEVNSTVLILGETGTGKELFAQAIHDLSPRKNKKLLVVNCSAYKNSSTHLESELFGHEKGSFTDAKERKIGIFEQASGGSVFLDEIHHLGLESQAKLLRAIQEKKIRRFGGVEEFSVDFRLICSSKPELKEMAKTGEFLPDLFFRIATLDLIIPPLRDRVEDIKPLTQYFLDEFEKEYGKMKQVTSAAMDVLKNYPWPGNVRQLRNLLEKLYVSIDGYIIRPSHLPDEFREYQSSSALTSTMSLSQLDTFYQNQMKMIILKALKKTEHNIKKTSEVLDVNRSTLNSRMRSLGILHMDENKRENLLAGLISKIENFTLITGGER